MGKYFKLAYEFKNHYGKGLVGISINLDKNVVIQLTNEEFEDVYNNERIFGQKFQGTVHAYFKKNEDSEIEYMTIYSMI